MKQIETGDAYEFDRKSEDELREIVAEQEAILAAMESPVHHIAFEPEAECAAQCRQISIGGGADAVVVFGEHRVVALIERLEHAPYISLLRLRRSTGTGQKDMAAQQLRQL